jgi:hypothetical protein
MNKIRIPYQSQLRPHYDFIRDERRRRKTWREIADVLGQRGVSITASAIYKFFKRQQVPKKLPLGFEDVAISAPEPATLTLAVKPSTGKTSAPSADAQEKVRKLLGKQQFAAVCGRPTPENQKLTLMKGKK